MRRMIGTAGRVAVPSQACDSGVVPACWLEDSDMPDGDSNFLHSSP